MAVRIRLMRMGKIRNPQYRIVVADSRKKRDGRAIENVGIYHPKEDPSRIEVNSERVQYWLAVGAQPSEPVLAILRKTGDWQKFKGLPPPSRPVMVAPPRADRESVFQAEAKAAAGLAEAGKKEKSAKGAKAEKPEPGEGAGKPAKKATKRAKAKDDQPKADQPKADQPKADQPKPAAGGEAATEQTSAAQAAATSEEQPGAQPEQQG